MLVHNIPRQNLKEEDVEEKINNDNKPLTMKVWVVIARIEELQARTVDKVFDSREKPEKYIRQQEKNEYFVNISGFDRSIEEWEVE
jgi:hypothetical protein